MKRTVSISLNDIDDDDDFFDSRDRLSSVIPLDLALGADDDDEFFDSSRMSFAGAASIKRIYSIKTADYSAALPAYDMWITEPGDVKERRKRLLQGMGLVSNKDLLRLATSKVVRTASIKPDIPKPASASATAEPPPPHEPEPKQKQPVLKALVLVRCRSDGDIDVISTKTKQRKMEILGPRSKNKITRTFSARLAPSKAGACQYSSAIRVLQEADKTTAAHAADRGGVAQCVVSDPAIGSFVLIKNLDTGVDFIVKESNEEGMWNKLNDLQTGKQLTMEEFEKSVGVSPVVKELMRHASRNKHGEGKKSSHFTKSFRSSTKKGSALLKNIKGAASGFLVVEKMEKVAKEEKEAPEKVPEAEPEKPLKHSPQWVDAHQHGKSVKEFTALHFTQEIQAHEGSIWIMRFSSDSRFLASAGEDTNVHVWEVKECEVPQPKPVEESSSEAAEPAVADDTSKSNHIALADVATLPSELRKKGKKSGKATVPDYVKLPETMIGLSEQPKYSLIGHKDEVLDLSWSQSQQLLSSSMDKTVRMWDLETQSCLKIFAHSDFVTCIQFNPVANNLFISGSLDGKLRIWSVPDRHVVDWTDVHEMVTSASYTPDGQGAIIGSQQGNCKMYSVEGSTIEHRMDIQKKKPQAKTFPSFHSQSKKLPGFQSPPPPGKITGFQFTPWDPSQVLITSADSHIGIYNAPDLVQKFRGFRNTSSQMSASFCPDGKHVISASEDSQVYIWKVEDTKNQAAAKKKTVAVVAVNSHESFACKDVSVAITWPGSTRFEAPLVDLQPKKNTKKPAQEEAVALPPLPKKKKEGAEERACCGEDQMACPRVVPAPSDEGVEASEASSAAVREGETPALSHSQSENASSTTVEATAWGLVIVTATVEGEIKVFQNFGLPVKVARQTLLF